MNTIRPTHAHETMLHEVFETLHAPQNEAFVAMCDARADRAFHLTMLELLEMSRTTADLPKLEAMCERIIEMNHQASVENGVNVEADGKVLQFLHIVRCVRRILRVKGVA